MKSRDERTELIHQLVEIEVAKPGHRQYPIKHWKGKNQTIYQPVIQIAQEYLMFRIENSRTEIQQLAFIRDRNLPADFFSDPESPKVQNAQESILVDMLRGEKKTESLLADLKNREQDDPCIITYDGYLVNGNRRTAALRQLKERYIECAVLPRDTNPVDIYLLEQQLQISQDFKAPYHWINELRNIEKGLQDDRFELDKEQIAKNLQLLDSKEVDSRLRRLNYVKAFLVWRKLPEQFDYHKLNNAEQAFKEIDKAGKRYGKDPRWNFLLESIFSLIESRPDEGRIYKHVGDLIRNFEQIDRKLKLDHSDAVDIVSMSDDPLDQLADTMKTDRSITTGDYTQSGEISAQIMEMLADIDAENKDRRTSEAVYDAVNVAFKSLNGLKINEESIKLTLVKSRLESIIDLSQALLQELAKL